MHIKGEKYNEHFDNDFQEWEQYDIVHVINPRTSSTISNEYIPQYISMDVMDGKTYQNITYKFITEIKSGLKLGRKCSDHDAKWGEKWFEINCKEAQLKDKTVLDVKIKFYSKFWTKNEIIEGECCH